jgi:hypothetical protein
VELSLGLEANLRELAPLVHLVAPALRFHQATDTLARSLSPQLDMVRVGLAEDWRRGLRVVLRR